MYNQLKATIDCEILTPLFISGNDSSVAELRIPSLIGALRYWFRATHNVESSKLFDLESAIFGNTEKRSKVRLRLIAPEYEQYDSTKFTKNRDSGTAYLWYSTTLGSNNRKHIAPGSYFRVIMTADSKDEIAFKEVLKTFWLLSTLGAIGTRSRRCAGSFRVRQIELNNDIWKVNFDIHDCSEFKEEIQKVVHLSSSSKRPAHSAFSEGFSHIWVAQLNHIDQGWEQAVERAGEAMKKYRLRRGLNEEHGMDYKTVKQYLTTSQKPETVLRASFGLPLRFQFKRLKKSARISPADRNVERRASPLHMSVKIIGDH